MRLLVVALLAAGALVAPAAAQVEPEGPDAAIADGSAQRALDAAKAKWKAKGPRSYQMVVRRVCFCTPEYRRPRTVVVHGGKIVKAAAEVREFATVPRLFRIVQKAIDDKVVNLSVTYDATRGYPRVIDVDRSLRIVDEEQSYGASRLKRL